MAGWTAVCSQFVCLPSWGGCGPGASRGHGGLAGLQLVLDGLAGPVGEEGRCSLSSLGSPGLSLPPDCQMRAGFQAAEAQPDWHRPCSPAAPEAGGFGAARLSILTVSSWVSETDSGPKYPGTCPQPCSRN